jgi:hypothetical protein
MTASPNKYSFENRKSEPIVAIIEPWAEEFVVPPGSTLSMVMASARSGSMETAVSENYFTVWLWPGCHVSVALDGKEQVRPSLSIPVPD